MEPRLISLAAASALALAACSAGEFEGAEFEVGCDLEHACQAGFCCDWRRNACIEGEADTEGGCEGAPDGGFTCGPGTEPNDANQCLPSGEGEGEGEGGGEGEGEGGTAVPDGVQELLSLRCAACHFEGNVPPDLSDAIRSYNNLVAVPSELSCAGLLLVAPGDSAQSCLVRTVVEGEAAEIMPPLGAPLSPEQVDVIRDWIDGLPPNLRACEAGDERSCPCPEVSAAQPCDGSTGRWLACGCPGAAQRPGNCASSPQIGVSCSDPELSTCPQHLQCDEDGWLACVAEYEREDAESDDCNGRDDDCDGKTDENFDLDGDPDNCGACGTTCAFPHASAVACKRGECVLVRCDDEFADLNGAVQDGCEYEGVKNLFVSARGGPDHDDWPTFPTVAEAHDTILDNEVVVIHLDAVPIFENVSITKPDVTLRGMDPISSTINATAEPHATLQIAADRVTVENLGVSGGHTGIQVLGQKDVVIRDVEVGAVTGPGSVAQGEAWGVGIHFIGSEDVLVQRTHISGISGGPVNVPVMYATGGRAAGLWFEEVVRGAAEAISIETINGQGRQDVDYFAPAQGVRATDSHNITLHDVRIRNVRSSNVGCTEIVCSAGVFIKNTTGFHAHRLLVHEIIQLQPNLLGCSVWLSGQSTVGATLERITLANQDGEGNDAGLCIYEGAKVVVTDSIFSKTARWAARDLSANPGGSHVFNSVVWLPGSIQDEFSSVAPDPNTIVRADPKFDPITGELRLKDDSPGIDAGRLACLEGTEPSCGEDPCISDVGYWAGTDQARAACNE